MQILNEKRQVNTLLKAYGACEFVYLSSKQKEIYLFELMEMVSDEALQTNSKARTRILKTCNKLIELIYNYDEYFKYSYRQILAKFNYITRLVNKLVKIPNYWY